MSDRTKPILAMERAAGEVGKTALANFVSMNPGWRGAHLADVLDEVHNADSYCAQIEDFYDLPDRPIAGYDDTLVVLALITLVMAKQEPTIKAVYDLAAAAAKEVA